MTKPQGRGTRDRLVGFSFNARTHVAKFSVYVPATAGRERKRLTTTADSYENAVRLWSEFRTRVLAGTQRRTLVVPTFRVFIADSFLLIAQNVSPATAREYRYIIDNHLLGFFGGFRLDEITSGDVNRFGALLKDRGYAPATVNGYMNVMALLLGYAVEYDVIPELPLKKKLKKLRVEKPCLELSIEERRAFLAAFDDEHAFREHLRTSMARHGLTADGDAAALYFQRFHAARPLFTVALETGLRRGDLLALRWKHVDAENGWIRIHMQKTRRDVAIPISTLCATALAECRRPGMSRVDHVFAKESGRPYDDSTLRRYFRIAKALAGITRRFRFHDLRHTFGSTLASKGVPLLFISTVMGHTNIATTTRYARPETGALEAVRSALDAPALPLHR